MIIINDFQQLKGQPLVATTGFFDGVHSGHRFLIREMTEIARERGLPAAVITFAEHPRTVLHADYQPKLLNSYEEKLSRLASTGIDYCIVLPFTPELASFPARLFVEEILSRQLHVDTLLIGYDHRFGRDRADGFEQYVLYGQACGIHVLQASAWDEGSTSVSSSEVRRLLLAGEVEHANRLLGYPYQLKGTIISGHKVGRTIGFPTANIRVDEPFKVIPAVGIYAVRVVLNDQRYNGMLYIGTRPTVDNGDTLSMEVHIFDFTGDIYDCEITVDFVYFVRNDMKFDGLDALKEQLAKDRQTVKRLLNG